MVEVDAHMTGRERIEAVLSGKTPQKVPWVPLIGRYYVQSLPAQGFPIESFAPKEKAIYDALKKDLCLAEIEAIRLTGGDILYRHVMGYTLNSDRCTYRSQEKEGKLYRGWETPHGELFETIELLHGTEYVHKYMIQNEEDVKKYAYVISSLSPSESYSDMREFDSYIGSDGIATFTGPVTPIQQLFQFTMGVEHTTYALLDFPNQMEQILETMQQLHCAVYEIIGNSPVGSVVITYEDTSTTVLSPSWYAQYEAPHLNAYADILKKNNKIHIAHMCGKISLLTDLLALDHYKGIDSVCPPETGDLECDDALEKTGKIIIGGLEPVLLTQMNAQQCYDYATEKLTRVKRVGGFNRFMLCSGDSVAAGTPMENLQAITQAVADFVIDEKN